MAWLVTASLEPIRDLMTFPPKLVPESLTYANYAKVLLSDTQLSVNFRYTLLNSLVISIGATLLTLAVSVTSAYVFTRFPTRFYNGIFFVQLGTQMIPSIALIIPLYTIYNYLGLYDTRLGMILLYTSVMLPYMIWILRGYLASVPFELEEAALVDGCTRFRILLRIVIPIAVPGIIAVSVYTFMENWNEFFFAYLLTRSTASTVQVSISQFAGIYSVDLGGMTASAVLSVIPPLVLTFLFQKYLIKGLSEGALKR